MHRAYNETVSAGFFSVVISHGITDILKPTKALIYVPALISVPNSISNSMPNSFSKFISNFTNFVFIGLSVFHFGHDIGISLSTYLHLLLFVCYNIQKKILAWNFLFAYMTVIHVPNHISSTVSAYSHIIPKYVNILLICITSVLANKFVHVQLSNFSTINTHTINNNFSISHNMAKKIAIAHMIVHM